MTEISILILDDSPEDIELIIYSIRELPFEYKILKVKNRKEYEEILHRDQIDIILSDYQMPAYTGIEALLFARSNSPESIFIFVTGTLEDEELAAETILQGASGYVLKNNLTRLNSVILRAIEKNKRMRIAGKLKKSQIPERVVNQINSNQRVIERIKRYLEKKSYSDNEISEVIKELDYLNWDFDNSEN